MNLNRDTIVTKVGEIYEIDNKSLIRNNKIIVSDHLPLEFEIEEE